MSQLDRWKSEWGDDYTDRNLLTAEDQLPLFRKILFNLEPELNSILEVGCGAGHNLDALKMLFKHAVTFGVEPNKKAAKIAVCRGLILTSNQTAYDLILPGPLS